MKMRIATGLVLVAGLGTGCSDSAALKRHLERADAFFERERYAEAAIEYRGALRINPTNAAALGALGVAHLRNGDYARAYPALREALALDPSLPGVRTRLAELYLGGGDPGEARRLAAEALAGNPEDLDALMVWAAAATDPAGVDESLAGLASRRGLHAESARYQLAVGSLQLRKGDLNAAGAAITEALRLDPMSPDALLAKAEWALRRGEKEEGRAALEQAYQIAPTSSLAGVRLAALHRMDGKPGEARRILDAMIAEMPTFVPALLELASMDVAERKYEEAARRIETLLAGHPRHPPALLLRARTHLLQGRLDAAEQEVAALIEAFPAYAAAHVERARIKVRKGRIEEAERDLLRALELAPGNVEAALALAELDLRRGRAERAIARLLPLSGDGSAERVQALLLLGSAYRSASRWPDALSVYRELASLLPDSPQPLYLAAMTLDAAKDVAGVITNLEAALVKSPDFVPAASSLVGILMREGRTNEAMARIDGWVAARPDVAGFHHLRASAKLAAGDDAGAEASLKRAIEAAPQNPSACMDLGRLYVRQGRIDEAMAQFRDSAAANPRDPVPHMMMAVLNQSRNRDDEAMRGYEKAIELAPSFVGALNNLAYLLAVREQDLDRALDLAQRARELAAGDAAVADTLALVALTRKDYRWALALLEECAPQLASVPEVQYRLGLARKRLGLEAGARDALLRALGSDRDFAGRDDARVLLSVLDVSLQDAGEADRERLEQALKILPGNPSALARLARIEERRHETAKAIRLNEEALKEAADYAPALIALTRLTVDQPERALAYGRKAREAAPQNAEAAHALGCAALKAGDYAWAHSILSEASVLAGNDPRVRRDLAEASLLCGRVEESRREAAMAGDTMFASLLDVYLGRVDNDQARSILDAAAPSVSASPVFRLAAAKAAPVNESRAGYRSLAEAYPRWGLPVRDLAVLSIEAGDLSDDALKAALRARELLPDDAQARRALGIAWAQRGSFAQAAPLLENAAATDGVALYWLATCQGETGPVAKALETLQRARDAGLPQALVAEAERRMKTWEASRVP